MADREAPITAHLRELRQRLFICVVALIAGVIVSFIFRDVLFDTLKRPGEDVDLYFHSLTGGVGPIMKMALLGGFILALPVWVYELVMFLSPGLTRQEKRFLYASLPGVLLFFLGGASFAYFVLAPSVVDFLIDFGSEVATPVVSVGSYIDVVVGLLFWMGLGFELPYLMYLLTFVGIGSASFFARQRRLWFVFSFVLAAVITPTFDPVNQAMVAGPFVVLYEIGILLSRFAARKPRRTPSLAAEGGR